MIKLPSVTIICIDCVNHSQAYRALKKSIEKIEFKQVLFITDKLMLDPDGIIDIITIAPITSKEEYSYFMLNRLNDYIHTHHCLVIQYDGYVINPNLWDDYFLNYDYIGAPWWYTDYNVGNGGFSLRSKVLLAACQSEDFKDFHPEDDRICRGNRRLLESKYNIKYAPDFIAEKFSFEPNNLHPVFNNRTFGFHGIPGFIL